MINIIFLPIVYLDSTNKIYCTFSAERKTKKDNSCKKEEIAKKPDAEKATENSNEATDIPENSKKTGKKPRFILFVGMFICNLLLFCGLTIYYLFYPLSPPP